MSAFSEAALRGSLTTAVEKDDLSKADANEVVAAARAKARKDWDYTLTQTKPKRGTTINVPKIKTRSLGIAKNLGLKGAVSRSILRAIR